MRHLHTDSHLRLAITAFQDSDGYVDNLLGLARNQSIARQNLNFRMQSRRVAFPFSDTTRPGGDRGFDMASP